MTVREVLSTISNSTRVCIQLENGTDIYRGYFGCMRSDDYYQIAECTVEKIGFFVSIFRKEAWEKELASTEEGHPLPDNISHMRFRDLDHIIWQRIVIRP